MSECENNIVYNEKDDQIFIKLDSNEEPVEFLIAKQPLEFIRAEILTKDEIRETVETGFYSEGVYSKSFGMQEFSIAMNVFITIDDFLRIVTNVEKLYY